MEFAVNLLDFADMLSCAVDLMEKGSHHHGQRVAYIAWRLFEQVRPAQDPTRLVIASLLHDIGIDSFEVKEKAREFRLSQEILWSHCQSGADLVETVDMLKDLKSFILYHHTNYCDLQKELLNIPLEAQMIHLADRIAVLIKPDRPVVEQVEGIVSTILKYKGDMFNPQLVEVFQRLSAIESFWLDIVNEYQPLLEQVNFPSMYVNMNTQDIRQFSHLCARIVDRKSPFTARHSQRIALIAVKLAKYCRCRTKICSLLR
jgi:response regulator RpfG family c-di-GMP phosphodiesterase